MRSHRARLVVLGFLFLAGSRVCPAQDSGPFEVELGVSAGLSTNRTGEEAAPRATEDVTNGVDLSELIRRIYVYRTFRERILLDIDYESSRSGEAFLGEGDRYALHYLGQADELVRSASIGNRLLDVHETSGSQLAPPGTQDVAASVSLGRKTGGGRFRLDGTARYGTSETAILRFVGSRQVTELSLPDVNHVRRTFYFVPDTPIDESSLRLYRSTAGPGDLTADGVRYELLTRTVHYDYDSQRGWIFLNTALDREQYLVGYYERGGEPVGSPVLGTDAIVDATGARADFSAASFPDSFVGADGVDYLVLADPGRASYWELRNGYRLPEPVGDGTRSNLDVRLTLTDTGSTNTAYDTLLNRHVIDAERGVLFFVFEDSVGFYPRPFPGERPFTAAVDPGNPFDPQNPIYGDAKSAEVEDSVNTVEIRYVNEVDKYEIPDIFVPGSVTVEVDGEQLQPGQFTVDEMTGIVEPAPGIVGRGSEVRILYRRGGEGDAPGVVTAGLAAGYEGRRVHAGATVFADVPLAVPGAPLIGTEQPVELGASSEFTTGLLPPSSPGALDLSVRAGGTLTRPGLRGTARIADMSTSNPFALSLVETDWMLASPSRLLPATPLADRGELLYENYRDATLLGSQLRSLSWDNSANPQFDYAEKSGPYNTADESGDGTAPSLVLEYRHEADATNPYVSVVSPLRGDLDRYEGVRMTLRGTAVGGAPVRLYAEVLSTYQEDLDGDNELDEEAGPDARGLTITPVGGGPTVIGTDPWGEPDGRVASEDLDGDGRLEPVGDYATDAEVGALLTGPAADHVVELPAGESDWIEVDLDLRDLLETQPRILDEAAAIRLTLVPAGGDGSVRTGTVLVNEIEFYATPVEVLTPSYLETERLTSVRHADLAAAPLSAAYPDDYEALHGSAAYRDREGHREEALSISLLPPLAAGERAVLAASVPAGSLVSYRSLVLYLFRPESQDIPAGLGMDLRIVSGPNDYLSAPIDPTSLEPGWNRVELALEGASLAYAHRVEVGLHADGVDVSGPFTLWTDEWHADGVRWANEAQAGIDLQFSWPHALLAAGGVSVLGNVETALGYGLEVGDGSPVHEARGAAATDLFRVLRFSADARARRPLGDGSDGTTALGAAVRLNDEDPRVPEIVHGYRYGHTGKESPAIVSAESVVVTEHEEDHAIWVDSTVALGGEAAGSYSFERRLESEDRITTVSDSGNEISRTGSARVSDEHTGSLGWRGGRTESGDPATAARAQLRASLGSTWSAPEVAFVGSPFAGYPALVASLFGGPVTVAPNAERSARDARIDAVVARSGEAIVGLELEGAVRLAQRDHDRQTGARTVRDELTVQLGVPVRLLGGDVTIEPDFSRKVTAQLPDIDVGRSAWSTLATPALPFATPPFWFTAPELGWARDNTVAALDELRAAGVTNSGITNEVGMAMSTRNGPWFVPSRASATVRSKLIQSDAVYGLVEYQAVSVGTTRTVPGARRTSVFSADAGVSHEADLRSDTRDVRVSGSVFWSTARAEGSSWQVSHTSSWSHLRYLPDDRRLLLFRLDPEREPEAGEADPGDRLSSVTSVSYVWQTERIPVRPSALVRRLGGHSDTQSVRNEERFVIETHDELPLRITAEHTSEIRQSDVLSVTLGLRAQGGVEETRSSGGVTRDASFGIEGSVNVVIRY